MVDSTLKEKQELMQNVKDTLKHMQSNLLVDMEQQYHQKIIELEEEVKNV